MFEPPPLWLKPCYDVTCPYIFQVLETGDIVLSGGYIELTEGTKNLCNYNNNIKSVCT